MMNYARFQDKIDVSRAILVIIDLTCLVGNSSKASLKNDLLDFSIIKFFGINTHIGKVFRPLPVRWEFPLPEWVKINTDEAARGYPAFATCCGIFHGSIGEFIGGFSVYLDVQTTLVAEFYGVLYAMEEVQKMGFTNVWVECDLTLIGGYWYFPWEYRRVYWWFLCIS